MTKICLNLGKEFNNPNFNVSIRIIVFCLFFVSHWGSCQDIFPWVNRQHLPSSVNHYDSYEVRNLSGNIKSIHETVIVKLTDAGAQKTVTEITFSQSGNISTINQVLADGSVSQVNFVYHADGVSYHQWWIYLFNNGEGLDTVRWDSLGMTEFVPLPDSINVNSQNQTTYFRLYEDEVFTFYDEFGRKIRDSIPSSPSITGHEILYKYKRKKIIRTEVFASENVKFKTIFKLDEVGNWTMCTIKNGRHKNAVINREYVYN